MFKIRAPYLGGLILSLGNNKGGRRNAGNRFFK